MLLRNLIYLVFLSPSSQSLVKKLLLHWSPRSLLLLLFTSHTPGPPIKTFRTWLVCIFQLSSQSISWSLFHGRKTSVRSLVTPSVHRPSCLIAQILPYVFSLQSLVKYGSACALPHPNHSHIEWPHPDLRNSILTTWYLRFLFLLKKIYALSLKYFFFNFEKFIHVHNEIWFYPPFLFFKSPRIHSTNHCSNLLSFFGDHLLRLGVTTHMCIGVEWSNGAWEFYQWA